MREVLCQCCQREMLEHHEATDVYLCAHCDSGGLDGMVGPPRKGRLTRVASWLRRKAKRLRKGSK